MQRTFVLAGVLTSVTMLFAAAAFAQSDADYQGWMKTNGATMQAVNKDIMAKDGSAVAADGQKLQGVFKQLVDFWQKRGAEDAVGFATKGEAAAEAISKAGAAGNFEQAAADAKSLQANCGGCHMAHRERTPEGTFKMK